MDVSLTSASQQGRQLRRQVFQNLHRQGAGEFVAGRARARHERRHRAEEAIADEEHERRRAVDGAVAPYPPPRPKVCSCLPAGTRNSRAVFADRLNPILFPWGWQGRFRWSGNPPRPASAHANPGLRPGEEHAETPPGAPVGLGGIAVNRCRPTSTRPASSKTVGKQDALVPAPTGFLNTWRPGRSYPCLRTGGAAFRARPAVSDISPDRI